MLQPFCGGLMSKLSLTLLAAAALVFVILLWPSPEIQEHEGSFSAEVRSPAEPTAAPEAAEPDFRGPGAMPSTPEGVCMYQLPGKFNVQLADSLGLFQVDPKPLDAKAPPLQGLYDTGAFTLERIVFTRMTQLTTAWRHPKHCKAFYVPYFTSWEVSGVGGKWTDRETPLLDDELLRLLVHLGEGASPGPPNHFIVAGRIYDDTVVFRHPRLQNVIKLTVEGLSRTNVIPDNLVSVPYPSSFRYGRALEQPKVKHVGPCWIWSSCFKPLGKYRTGPLASVVGGFGKGPFSQAKRHQVINWCRARARDGNCTVMDTGLREFAFDKGAAINMQAFGLYSSSVFCLQPPGDTPTRKATFDALLAGCIPVIFDSRTLSLYNWHTAKWGSISVLYEMVNSTPAAARWAAKPGMCNGRRSCLDPFYPDPNQENVVDYLARLEQHDPQTIRDKQLAIAEWAFSLQYSVESAPTEMRRGPDALDVILRRVLEASSR